MGLLDLLIASSIPVLKVLLITAIGSYLALDHVDVSGEDARKHVNNHKEDVVHAIQYSHHICYWFPYLAGLLSNSPDLPSHLHGLIVGCCAAGKRKFHADVSYHDPSNL
ncbi:hypothetical protein OIU77_026274 [Salix suchowensis]|uniref:Uncharacterized protein n=1 Tax=Salix suchowensis TaxID=1278906 RepID=A0ABQ9C0V5_9ROSI|nr:hypothetical protein OIU77_026274 [Salix suchowensis]